MIAELKSRGLVAWTPEWIIEASKLKFKVATLRIDNANGSYSKVTFQCVCHKEETKGIKAYQHLYSPNGCIYDLPKSTARNPTLDTVLMTCHNLYEGKYLYLDANKITNNDEVHIYCEKHGLVFAKVKGHMNKSCMFPCSECRRENNSNTRKDTTEIFINKSIAKYGNKYDRSLVVYVNSETKVRLKCNVCNTMFDVQPDNHLFGKNGGCKTCRNNLHKVIKLLSWDEVKSRIYRLRGSTVDLSKGVYKGINKHMKFICTIHNRPFTVPVDSVLRGKRGCSECRGGGFSQGSLKWILWLFSILKKYEPRLVAKTALTGSEHVIRNSKYRADALIGVVGGVKIIAEYHGDYWHGNPKYFPQDLYHSGSMTVGEKYQKTLAKHDHIIKEGYKLIYIWESDWFRVNRLFKRWNMLLALKRHVGLRRKNKEPKGLLYRTISYINLIGLRQVDKIYETRGKQLYDLVRNSESYTMQEIWELNLPNMRDDTIQEIKEIKEPIPTGSEIEGDVLEEL
jgi:hypothetical protein